MVNALISPLAIAPMIDWTNSPFRVFMRLLAPEALLYTEMQTTGAISYNPKRALFFTAQEQPLALQLGGADLKALVACAIEAQAQGFAEINFNLGCPSSKVQSGRFGACLMYDAEHAAACLAAMKAVVSIPVTAKIRLGVDKLDSYEFFYAFATKLINAGCDKLIVHARKAWLNGLNPKQNRTIPPVNYDYVYRLKQAYPNIPVVINGNINNLTACNTHMAHVDGVMLGRLACDNPFLLTSIHHYFYPSYPLPTRLDVIEPYAIYLTQQFNQGTSLSLLLKPILTFMHGLSGASVWKKQLAQAQQLKNLNPFYKALALLKAD